MSHNWSECMKCVKITVGSVLCCLLIFAFPLFSSGATEEIYSQLNEALNGDTRKLLEDFGLSGIFDGDLSRFSSENAIDAVLNIFSTQLSQPLKAGGICLGLLFVSALLICYLPENGDIAGMCKSVMLMCMMFVMINFCTDIFSRCCDALLLTKDFMKVLIPIFAGVVSFSGNVSLALSFNSVAFAFSECVSYFFTGAVPSFALVLTAVSAAGAVNPLMKISSVGKTFSKILNFVMAFVAGIFVAVLSVRGVIAGAADTVGIRGVRFLVSNAVPVVGSALGEALNTVAASIGLIKNTVGMFGIAAVVIINLPVLITLVLWKGVLSFLSLASDMLDIGEIKSFSENLNGVLSVMLAAVCFSALVFVISIAVILTVGRNL